MASFVVAMRCWQSLELFERRVVNEPSLDARQLVKSFAVDRLSVALDYIICKAIVRGRLGI